MILFIDVTFDLAQPFIESILVTRLLVLKLVLQLLGVLLYVVIVVAHRKSLNHVVPTTSTTKYIRLVSAFPCLFMLFVKGSRVSPAILEPSTLPLIDLGLPDLMTQLKFRASLMKASLSRFSATSRMSFEVTLLFPGKAYISTKLPCS
jgi:hypothetical protein